MDFASVYHKMEICTKGGQKAKGAFAARKPLFRENIYALRNNLDSNIKIALFLY